MESVLSMGLIAIALPAVMLVMSASHDGVMECDMAGHARRLIPAYASSIRRGELEVEGQAIAWAHAADGSSLGRLKESEYRRGLSRLEGRAVRFVVVASPLGDGSHGVGKVQLALEHPAAAQASRRKRIEFHTVLLP